MEFNVGRIHFVGRRIVQLFDHPIDVDFCRLFRRRRFRRFAGFRRFCRVDFGHFGERKKSE